MDRGGIRRDSVSGSDPNELRALGNRVAMLRTIARVLADVFDRKILSWLECHVDRPRLDEYDRIFDRHQDLQIAVGQLPDSAR